MRGAKPKATVIRLIQGNPGRRPINAQEAKPIVAIPDAPSFMKGPALAEWRRITKLLVEVGLITKLDRAVIASYCQAWARWVECERMLETTGLIVKAPSGYPMYSPYLAASNKAMDQLRQMSAEIGLSGSSRSRIKVGDPAQSADAAENFLNNAG